jgi:hypothetical protein
MRCKFSLFFNNPAALVKNILHIQNLFFVMTLRACATISVVIVATFGKENYVIFTP